MPSQRIPRCSKEVVMRSPGGAWQATSPRPAWIRLPKQSLAQPPCVKRDRQMCHLLLLLPFVMLPVFWLWPASVAVPVYTTAALGAGVLYWYAWKSARMPKLSGAEGMLGARGRIVGCGGGHGTLFFHGELWAADAIARPRLKK